MISSILNHAITIGDVVCLCAGVIAVDAFVHWARNAS